MSLAFSPDGNLLAVGCDCGLIYIYRLINGKWAQVSEIEYFVKSVRFISL